MDKHYLTPLFCPETIAVFAGRADDPASQTRHARLLHDALKAQRFSGTLLGGRGRRFLLLFAGLAAAQHHRFDQRFGMAGPEDLVGQLRLNT